MYIWHELPVTYFSRVLPQLGIRKAQVWGNIIMLKRNEGVTTIIRVIKDNWEAVIAPTLRRSKSRIWLASYWEHKLTNMKSIRIGLRREPRGKKRALCRSSGQTVWKASCYYYNTHTLIVYSELFENEPHNRVIVCNDSILFGYDLTTSHYIIENNRKMQVLNIKFI